MISGNSSAAGLQTRIIQGWPPQIPDALTLPVLSGCLSITSLNYLLAQSMYKREEGDLSHRCHSVQGLHGIHLAGIAIWPGIHLPVTRIPYRYGMTGRGALSPPSGQNFESSFTVGTRMVVLSKPGNKAEFPIFVTKRQPHPAWPRR